MTPSPADRIAEIKVRLEAATPGPWSTEYDSYGDEWWFGGSGAGQNTIWFSDDLEGVFPGDCRAEAALVANAPVDLAYLLSRVEELQAQLDAANRELDEQRWYGEQLQASLESCSGNHLEIEEYPGGPSNGS